MVFMQATLQVIHEKLPEVFDLIEKRLVPLAAKHGMKLAGSWRTFVGNEDEITDLWAFDNMDHLAKVFRALGKDTEWQEGITLIRRCVTHETIKLMAPAPFSPLK